VIFIPEYNVLIKIMFHRVMEGTSHQTNCGDVTQVSLRELNRLVRVLPRVQWFKWPTKVWLIRECF